MFKLNYWRLDRHNRIKRMLVSGLLALLMIMTVSFSSLTVHAASSLSFDDIILLYAYMCNSSNNPETGDEQVDWVLSAASDSDDNDKKVLTKASNINWTTITTLSNAYRDTQNGIDSVICPTKYKMGRVAALIVSSYGNKSKFESAVNDVIKSAGNSITVDITTGDYYVTVSEYAGKMSSAVTNINSSLVAIAAQSTFDQIYDMSDWDPNEGIAADALAVVYNVINVVFYVVANLLMWLFMGQTAFDMLYIVLEPIRPFIGPKGSSGGGLAANNGGEGVLSKLHIPICSNAAAEAVNGAGGGLGGNGAGSNSSKAAIVYLGKRAPLLITIAIYFILAVLGYWRLVISWVAGFVIKIIDFIISLGG